MVGALAGLVWESWWTPPSGVVRGHAWTVDFYESRGLFSGTALYVVVGLLGGILVGVTSAYFVDRVELVTLAAVAAGSVLAAWLMLQVGTALAPPDPAVAGADLAQQDRAARHAGGLRRLGARRLPGGGDARRRRGLYRSDIDSPVARVALRPAG